MPGQDPDKPAGQEFEKSLKELEKELEELKEKIERERRALDMPVDFESRQSRLGREGQGRALRRSEGRR